MMQTPVLTLAQQERVRQRYAVYVKEREEEIATRGSASAATNNGHRHGGGPASAGGGGSGGGQRERASSFLKSVQTFLGDEEDGGHYLHLLATGAGGGASHSSSHSEQHQKPRTNATADVITGSSALFLTAKDVQHFLARCFNTHPSTKRIERVMYGPKWGLRPNEVIPLGVAMDVLAHRIEDARSSGAGGGRANGSVGRGLGLAGGGNQSNLMGAQQSSFQNGQQQKHHFSAFSSAAAVAAGGGGRSSPPPPRHSYAESDASSDASSDDSSDDSYFDYLAAPADGAGAAAGFAAARGGDGKDSDEVDADAEGDGGNSDGEVARQTASEKLIRGRSTSPTATNLKIVNYSKFARGAAGAAAAAILQQSDSEEAVLRAVRALDRQRQREQQHTATSSPLLPPGGGAFSFNNAAGNAMLSHPTGGTSAAANAGATGKGLVSNLKQVRRLSLGGGGPAATAGVGAGGMGMGWVDGWVDDEYDQPQPIGTPRAADIPEEAFSSAAGEGGPQPVAALLRSLLGGDRKVGTTTIGKGGGRGKGAAPRAATRSSPQPQQRAGDRAGTAGGPRRRSSVAITTTTTTTTSTSSSPTAQDAPAPLTLAAPTVVVPNSSFAAAAAGVTTEFHDVVVDVADEGSDDAFDNHLSAEERKGRQRRKKQQHGSYDTRSYGDDDDYGDDDGWGSGSGSAYSDSYSRNTVRNEAVNVTEEHAMRLAWLQGPVEALLTARLTSRPTVIDSQGRLVVPSRKGGGILEGGVHPSHLRGSGGKGGGASRPQSAGGNGSRGGRQPLLRPDGTAYFENVPSMVRREEDKMERLLMELGEHDPALLEQIHRKLMSTNPAYASAADVASGGGPSGRPLSALSAASSRPIHTVRGVPSSLAFASPIRRPNPSHDVSGVDTGGYHHGEGRDMIGDSESGGIAATVAARAANTSAKPFAETRPGPNRLMFNNSRPMSAAALRGAPPRQAAWPEGTDDEESEEERAAAPNRRMNRPASANAAVGRGGGGGASSLHTSTNASALGAEGAVC